MLEYVNSFSCASNPMDNVVILKFAQEDPSFDGTPSNHHQLASLVISKNLAMQIAAHIIEACNMPAAQSENTIELSS